MSNESSTWSINGPSCSSLTYDSYMFEFYYYVFLIGNKSFDYYVFYLHVHRLLKKRGTGSGRPFLLLEVARNHWM